MDCCRKTTTERQELVSRAGRESPVCSQRPSRPADVLLISAAAASGSSGADEFNRLTSKQQSRPSNQGRRPPSAHLPSSQLSAFFVCCVLLPFRFINFCPIFANSPSLMNLNDADAKERQHLLLPLPALCVPGEPWCAIIRLRPSCFYVNRRARTSRPIITLADHISRARLGAASHGKSRATAATKTLSERTRIRLCSLASRQASKRAGGSPFVVVVVFVAAICCCFVQQSNASMSISTSL